MVHSIPRVPGRCPGLACCAPSGLSIPRAVPWAGLLCPFGAPARPRRRSACAELEKMREGIARRRELQGCDPQERRKTDMATAQLGTLLRHIHHLASGGGEEPRADRQLLEDFAARRDEAAFAALVSRHGPMVLRVCRRV